MYGKHRLEALSDGIFAIAMTLLVLDLKVPTGVPHGELWHALTHDGHAWISFVVTFAIAARFWMLQHQVFSVVETIGSQTAIPTFIFLGLVSIMPFSTSLWGQHIKEPLAFSLYFLNQFGIASALVAKLEIARFSGHLCAGAEPRYLRLQLWIMCLAMGTASVAAVLIPLQYVGVVFILLGTAVRRIRYLESRHKKAIAGRLTATGPHTHHG